MTEKFLDPEQTIKDLRAAAAILTESPWGQGQDYNRHNGCLCAFGAIRVAIGALVLPGEPGGRAKSMDYVHDGMSPDEARLAIARRDRAGNAARAFKRVMNSEIVTFNDIGGRTRDQVVRALETVAHALEADPSRA